jgi:2-polyprenyl-3-methyl-5-hydroxy-6-metoxy-1,4-benzoquinol methylase
MDYERVRSQFNSLADTYSEVTSKQHAFFDSNTQYLQEYKVAIAKELVPEPKTVLDYGCGIGLLQEFLGSYYSASTIYAADISEDSLAHIHHHYPDTKVLDCETALQQSFDLIVVSCVLHHVPIEDREGLVKRLMKAVNEGGSLLIFEHNPLNPVTQYLVNTCPIDEDAILLRRSECSRLIHLSEETKASKSGYTLFFPGMLKALRPLEKKLRWLPAGGQYFLLATKARSTKPL